MLGSGKLYWCFYDVLFVWMVYFQITPQPVFRIEVFFGNKNVKFQINSSEFFFLLRVCDVSCFGKYMYLLLQYLNYIVQVKCFTFAIGVLLVPKLFCALIWQGSTNLESIQIIKKPGGSLKDSFLDEG